MTKVLNEAFHSQAVSRLTAAPEPHYFGVWWAVH